MRFRPVLMRLLAMIIGRRPWRWDWGEGGSNKTLTAGRHVARLTPAT